MLRRVKAVVAGELAEQAVEEPSSAQKSAGGRMNAVFDGNDCSDPWLASGLLPMSEAPRFPYSRPEFLYLSEEEVALSADKTTRPVLTPKDPGRMPLFAGYAECISAGKTELNEDQASARILTLRQTGWRPPSALGNSSSGSAKRSVSECARPATELAANGETEREKKTSERRHSGQTDEDLLCDLSSLSTEQGGNSRAPKAEAAYFAIFDGHAGCGAALVAANCLHEHVRERLCQVLETVLHLDRQEQFVSVSRSTAVATKGRRSGGGPLLSPNGKYLTRDSLIVGAMETAFVEMDEQISEEKMLWRISGGAAACVVLFFLGRCYVANAGDCRALVLLSSQIGADGSDEVDDERETLDVGRVRQLSTDHTPENERKRLQFLAFRNSELLGTRFSRFEYSRFLTRKDVRKKVLYRDWFMDGWAAKTVRETDLRHPLVSDGPRKRRLLNTIGVTRGFGDHHLMTNDERIPLKPFLTPVPQVRVFDMSRLNSIGEDDVVVLASDGLWDALDNAEVARIVRTSFARSTAGDETLKYTVAGQELVSAARGEPTTTGRWQLTGALKGTHGGGGGGGSTASCDDISVFVLPLKYALCPSSCDDDDVELLH